MLGWTLLSLRIFFSVLQEMHLKLQGPPARSSRQKCDIVRPSFDRSSCRHSASETPLLRCAYRRSDERFHLKAQTGTVLGYPMIPNCCISCGFLFILRECLECWVLDDRACNCVFSMLFLYILEISPAAYLCETWCWILPSHIQCPGCPGLFACSTSAFQSVPTFCIWPAGRWWHQNIGRLSFWELQQLTTNNQKKLFRFIKGRSKIGSTLGSLTDLP